MGVLVDEWKTDNLYVCLQGSLGFVGMPGVMGEKGRRVKTVVAVKPHIRKSHSEKINLSWWEKWIILTPTLQGPAGQPGTGGQRGANVSPHMGDTPTHCFIPCKKLFQADLIRYYQLTAACGRQTLTSLQCFHITRRLSSTSRWVMHVLIRLLFVFQ